MGIGYEVCVCVPHVDQDWRRPFAAVAVAATIAVVGWVVREEPGEEHQGALDYPRKVGQHPTLRWMIWVKKRKEKGGVNKGVSQGRWGLKGCKVYSSHVCSKSTHPLDPRQKQFHFYNCMARGGSKCWKSSMSGPGDRHLGRMSGVELEGEPSMRGGDGNDDREWQR
jgi:hypothetical protein